jgi:hypothetical protein
LTMSTDPDPTTAPAAPSSRPTCFASTAWALVGKTRMRGMTKSQRIPRERGNDFLDHAVGDPATVLGDLRPDQLPQVRRSRSWVPFSSGPIRREYPTTSAARMAVRRRVAGIVDPAVYFPTEINPKLPPFHAPSSRLSGCRGVDLPQTERPIESCSQLGG